MSKRQRGQFAAYTLDFPRKVRLLKDKIGIGHARALQPDEPTPPFREFSAIWDTGASQSVITESVVSALGLSSSFPSVTLQTANGSREASVYLVNIYFGSVRITGVQVLDAVISDTDVLIGMDVIGSGDFAITHSDGRTCMSFRAPPGKRIDYIQQFNAYNRR